MLAGISGVVRATTRGPEQPRAPARAMAAAPSVMVSDGVSEPETIWLVFMSVSILLPKWKVRPKLDCSCLVDNHGAYGFIVHESEQSTRLDPARGAQRVRAAAARSGGVRGGRRDRRLLGSRAPARRLEGDGERCDRPAGATARRPAAATDDATPVADGGGRG